MFKKRFGFIRNEAKCILLVEDFLSDEVRICFKNEGQTPTSLSQDSLVEILTSHPLSNLT